jgi:DNA-binding transcriptional MerR regulator
MTESTGRPGLMTIAAFARSCGASAKTLRFYDAAGLFRPAATDPRTRYRYYTADQLREFARIQALRDCGASLADIRGVLGLRSSARAQESLLRKLRSANLRRLDAVRRSLAWLDGELGNLAQASPPLATITWCPTTIVTSMRIELRSYADIQQPERALWDEVVPRQDRALRGVLWHRCADRGVIDAEPFVEVAGGARHRAGMEVRELPGTYAVRAFSSFDDDEAEATHLALSRWIRERGFSLGGPRREIYRGSLLEIQHPLRAQ